MTAVALAERDYFTDRSVLLDPYEFFEAIRHRGPVCWMEDRGYLLVTGFEECVEVHRNSTDFSALNALPSVTFPLPFTPEGDDISKQLEAHRHLYPGGDLVVSYDGKPHTDVRSLISRIFTPSRLKANEDFMKDYAHQLVGAAAATGACELIKQIAAPFVTLVIADLQGVPAEDRVLFEQKIAEGSVAGNIDGSSGKNPSFNFIGQYMARYLQERAQNPGEDLLSELVTSTYPDGSKPDMQELIKLSTFLFAAGQDTSAKLIGNAMRYVVDVPGLQQQLREDRDLIPWMFEEVLRLEGSTKITSRIARRDTTIGGMKVAAGTEVVLSLAAANRDPRRWGEDAHEFRLKRQGVREHLSFGRGSHTCAGAPLARREVSILLNSFFDHTSDIKISEAHHGKSGSRQYQFEPSFLMRGLDNLHLELQL